MSIITDPNERAERAVEKRRLLLRFLRDELYTTMPTAAAVLGIGERAARATVASLETAGAVKRWPVQLLDGLPSIVVVGITPRGQSLAFDVDAGETASPRAFEPSRFRLTSTLRHTLDLQRLRIAATRGGHVKRWAPGNLLRLPTNATRPDAVCLTSKDQRVAVEVERTIKTAKRYAGILESHLTAIQQGKWARVVWTCPDQETAKRVRALVTGVKRVRLAGIDTKIDPLTHHGALSFCTYSEFVSTL